MKMIDSFNGGRSGAALREVLPGTSPGPAVPRPWQWHYQALLKLRERLLSHRLQLTAQAAISMEPFDSADSADDDFEHDLALGQLAGEQDVLYEIQAALHRIRAGTYGLCEVTGEPMSKARLRAVPWTRFCQAVEERLENDGTLRTAHLGKLRSLNHMVTRSADADIPDEEAEAL
jgi:RNA polymerase-binding transcription factor DksA